ncbi:MAG: hypothetical protein ACLTMP_03985 [Eggerthella lenta]
MQLQWPPSRHRVRHARRRHRRRSDSGATPTTITLNSDATGELNQQRQNVILDLNSHTYNVVQELAPQAPRQTAYSLSGQHRGHQERHHDGQRERGPALHDPEHGDLTLENVVIRASGLGNGDSTVNNCGNLTVPGANAVSRSSRRLCGDYRQLCRRHASAPLSGRRHRRLYTEGSFWEASGAGQDHSALRFPPVTGSTIGSIGISYWDAAKDLAWTFDVGPDATIGTVNDFAANVGTGYYASLKGAIAAAQPGDTVTLTNVCSFLGAGAPAGVRCGQEHRARSEWEVDRRLKQSAQSD